MKSIMALFLMGVSGLAVAAPFCAVNSAGKFCNYYSYEHCISAAGYGGACVANENQARSGGAPFCVVSAIGAQCHFYDYNQCMQAASNANGQCVANR